jgi:ribosomal protein S12 methylthiotransferase
MGKKIHLVSLGCAKNLVDSEVMLGLLRKSGWTVTQEPAEAEAIIVNSCSFIEPAINESIDTILELARFKQNGTCKRMIVAGCLPERFGNEISETLPEIDVFLGTGAYDRIVHAVDGTLGNARCVLPKPESAPLQREDTPRLRTGSHTAYIKVAEGCSNRCTYCIIPRLRGKQRSRPVESIIAEAAALISSGTKELILVGQDTTNYGTDLDPGSSLALLLGRLSRLSPDVWFRVLYGHPNSIDEAFIRMVEANQNICSYFDIPIQHASDVLLKKMGRSYTSADLYRIIDTIRSASPDSALRTTAIVGFPGEKDRDFNRLIGFIKKIRFDNLGAFRYSDFEDLPSHGLSGHVADETAKKRYDRLMAYQLDISKENNLKHIGRTYTVLVDAVSEDRLFMGRTAFQAPEVDGVTYIKADKLLPGSFIRVKITDTFAYDLLGEPA